MERLTEMRLTGGGEEFVVRGDRTVYWPRERLLAAADVHVGKAESLRRDGVAVPDGAMYDDLLRLTRAVDETGAQRLVVIGDLVHDQSGLTPSVVEFVGRWRRQVGVKVELVVGNHDRRAVLPSEWDLEIHDPVLRVGTVAFAHEAPVRGVFTLVGHVHPAVRISGVGDGVRLPCFHLTKDGMILPAFTSLASGATVSPNGNDTIVALVDAFLVALPAS